MVLEHLQRFVGHSQAVLKVYSIVWKRPDLDLRECIGKIKPIFFKRLDRNLWELSTPAVISIVIAYFGFGLRQRRKSRFVLGVFFRTKLVFG